ncbi:E3 ubiquitin/ISG15 ligase TRIM25 isoform X2 [Myripristis murdjan]|uniref:E3 ubiquitin/ISG15 ligase TRIM25 isoform X2 n=1 Tax=Myripristis murdjan TaxID=586833 RepID=UPI0011763D0A|nr:E3 ubiquitin/ISG15 ligase TRIM25 isoform X2 [Myripristis murdjan]
MAASDMDELSLLTLEEELTCSICLCPFETPVTTPCGHNFCQNCLFATWTDSFCCPQCRTHFATKPELKKNTVLSAVVETFKLRSSRNEPLDLYQEEVQVEKEAAVICDMCMKAEASKTCLTCLASYCEEHLMPHRENPNFRLHQLTEPLGDLSERMCPDHHKLMDFFCVQHERVICSFCLQQVHKGCSFKTPDEQKAFKETELRNKLSLLDGKIEKTKTVLAQMRTMQDKLKESAASKKKALAAEYQQMREMLDRDESAALSAVDHEQESGQTKLRTFLKKFTENTDKMSQAKDDVNNTLSQSHTLSFLQASVVLPPVVIHDPYAPRVTMDSKTVSAIQAFAAVMKEHLTEILKQPTEARLQMLKPALNFGIAAAAERPVPVSGFSVFQPGGAVPLLGMPLPPSQPGNPKHIRSQSPGAPLKAGQKKKPQKQTKKPPNAPKGNAPSMKAARSMDNLQDLTKKDKSKGQPPEREPKVKPETSDVLPDITSAAKRNDLLKYGSVLTLDPKTAHKRIILSEDLTTASVSDEPTNYHDCPSRFSVCSQVLTSKGFSRGRHYWEVKMSCNNFIGIGLAYNSIDRKGPASRLGRNAQSWCVEWFNVKLSAWHASSETVLLNPNSKRVGVLLDCEEGTATFYNVADRAYPFHTFVFPFSETVYPAFWIFSSGSSITLCKLQA